MRYGHDLVDVGQWCIADGYDYTLQVWIKNYIIQCCAHPESMRKDKPCCNQYLLAGRDIRNIIPQDRESKASLRHDIKRMPDGKFWR